MPLHGENRVHPAYTSLRQVAGGGSALIHLGFHVGWGTDCVQKTYPRPGRDDAIAFTEPRLLRHLKHQHIVEILDAQPDGDRPDHVTMVMPAYPGGDLRQLIERAPRLSVGQVVEWTRQIASALDYLHTTAGYLHRDVKPGNILLDADRKALLCDFGSAARTSVTGHSGPIRATFVYQPPEVALYGWMSAKSDVYSLGLTAIELLDGAFLYERLDAAVLQARVDRGKRAYADIALSSRRRGAHVPPQLRTLLGRCVDADADRRPTAADLCAALHALKFVDWTHTTGSGSDGEWLGTWPPRARADKAVSLRVTSEVPTRGRNAGRRVLHATYRKAATSGWRTVGSTISPLVADIHDDAAVSRFLSTVAQVAAKRFPA